ncbi:MULTISPECIES: flagellar export chaperone FliS [Thiomicrorhabdus]|uniref:Flagellar secretion chaperone FliS n=1 Tax=Thiomicrorhabdus heinhorstiae TaxID=2748010 RepID=A0ABS0BX66_9GAMM|nr:MULTISPECIES: flagellar export chaperone FliS [Thiomicrorhabdus]MBF6058387.1 flagellar export chaperone FliS [Thiomicrorhabdus heinhorstiae]
MNAYTRNRFATQYAKNFAETSVSEATPHKLVSMLYAALVKNLNLTKAFMAQKKFADKAKVSNKALAILLSLKTGLDMEKGEEVADNLFQLYDYCYRRLVEASAKNDPAMIDELLLHVKGLQEAWDDMPDQIKYAEKHQLETHVSRKSA